MDDYKSCQWRTLLLGDGLPLIWASSITHVMLDDAQGTMLFHYSREHAQRLVYWGTFKTQKGGLILDFQGQESKPFLDLHHNSVSVGTKPLIFQHRAECTVGTSGIYGSLWRLDMTANYQTATCYLLIGAWPRKPMLEKMALS